MDRFNLDKVALTEHGQRFEMAKKDGTFGDIDINLNWNRGGKKGFFGFGGTKSVDLDLGCLYELQNGEKSVVQALGNCFGDFDASPFIQLMGDDRTGEWADGETIRINGKHWRDIKRVMIYTFIYEGAPNWAATDAVVNIKVPDESPLEIRLTSGRNDQGLCGIAMVENAAGGMRVTRYVTYHRDQQQLDRAHGWGMSWGAGRKD